MFVDMPLDNRTVDQFAAIAAVQLSQAVLKQQRWTKRSKISSGLIVL
jgi:hypothetical protein